MPVVAVLVHVILVAGVQPLTQERLLALAVLVQIKQSRRFALDQQVSDLAARQRIVLSVRALQLVAWEWLATRARPDIAGAVRKKNMKVLRRPNAVDDVHA